MARDDKRHREKGYVIGGEISEWRTGVGRSASGKRER
jgi:hypothetical protein